MQAAKIFFHAARVQKRHPCGEIRHFPQKSEKRIFCRIVTVEKAPYYIVENPLSPICRGISKQMMYTHMAYTDNFIYKHFPVHMSLRHMHSFYIEFVFPALL